MNPVQASATIGVFDSGVGGLSVLQALRLALPHERFVYLADSGHAPYGERDDVHVTARARAITRHLLAAHGIKALVVACNTATAAAIDTLRQDHPALPLIGVEPALKPAALASRTRRVAVLATRSTLGSRRLAALQAGLAGQAEFVLQPCDGLAHAIERQCETQDATETIALCDRYTRACGTFGTEPGQIDCLVLGCTHYPFALDVWRRCVGPEVRIIDTGEPVARHTRDVLHARDLASGVGPGGVALYTTGQPQRLATAAQAWLGQAWDVPALDI